ncbi:hypothetical protein [Nocardioides humi]|uniref:hypothetical protein n=1 Tax=Nocardioides humi TaxID=449461 RepID=UPI0015E8514F|nr:hypothetical protein [Nocardioides humi]
MCRAVRCRRCGKTTWSGCGQHVASVRALVPAAQWCGGHEDDGREDGGSLLRRLFGR